MDQTKHETMKLAVRREPSHIPLAGFHYMLFPIKMECDSQAAIYQQMGHIIIEVDTLKGERLLSEGAQALRHQIEIAYLAEQTLVSQ